MKDQTSFKKGGWNESDYQYIYSLKCRSFQEFVQEDGCICNKQDSKTGEYDYVSVIAKKKYHTGALLSAHCSFEKYGAPIIVIAEDIGKDRLGRLRFGRHFEVVAYEGGVNVWYLEPAGDTVRPVNIIRRKFDVPAKKELCLTVAVNKQSLSVSLEENRFTVGWDGLPAEFYAGITACEGINRFYDFSAEE
ncbi:MAG: hypothetical protein ACERKO_03180 [Acetanaerobacterium sp.]